MEAKSIGDLASLHEMLTEAGFLFAQNQQVIILPYYYFFKYHLVLNNMNLFAFWSENVLFKYFFLHVHTCAHTLHVYTRVRKYTLYVRAVERKRSQLSDE